MITDIDALVRACVLRLPSVVAVAGTRIYVATDLPPGYDPNAVPARPTTTGPAVFFTGRGGRPSVTSVLSDPTYLARCYAANEVAARDLDARLFVALHDRSFGRIRSIRCTVTGQHTQDSATGWHFFLSTWQLIVVIA